MNLAWLHTAGSNEALFKDLLSRQPADVPSAHWVKPDLLAIAQSGTDKNLAKGLVEWTLEALENGAVAGVCTCSTLGGIAENVGVARGLPIMRIDRPMAEQAAGRGGQCLAVACLESTVDPTRALLSAVADKLKIELDVRVHLVTDAWSAFLDGDNVAYREAVAQGVKTAFDHENSVILAQTSMWEAAALCLDLPAPVFSSAESGVAAAIDLWETVTTR
jgi:hypothetical protein